MRDADSKEKETKLHKSIVLNVADLQRERKQQKGIKKNLGGFELNRTTESHLVSVEKREAAYYFKIGDCSLKGPFKEEIDAYKQAVKDLSKIIHRFLKISESLEEKFSDILYIITGSEEAAKIDNE